LEVRMKQGSGAVLLASWGGASSPWVKLNEGSGHSAFEANKKKEFRFAGPLYGPEDRLCLKWKNHVNSGRFVIDVVTLRDFQDNSILAEMKHWTSLYDDFTSTCEYIPWKQN
ncbi:unnamed protein product, partial [Polarella glacialis]